ncbi:MAG TPA: hypothetical protein VK533_09450 [Sphingomonas sp.]|uniref:hypothetical protein n=1 Tax=Sphingomonas sp. TaxID=28214 RepID=UPI002C9CAEC5|nr:hypothetical protein [Sphingomonas sp.]HMI19757.1 hypothetical protein [Sphingomonas sp.]
MARTLIALVAGGLLAAPACASTDALSDLLKGKTADAPRRCIFPDRSAQPEIIDGTAIVYRDARYTYVARFKGGCPALREGRRIVTRGAGGQLCENDPVHVTETTGADFGFCTFDQFTPYRKAR